MNKLIPAILVTAIVVGAAAFYGGMQYQKSQRGAGFAGRGGQFRQGFAGGALNNGVVRGQILSNDGRTMTVKLPDGSSKIVIFSGNASITEATSSSAAALQSGKEVMVFGTTNSDGSVTAQNVQINPQTRMGNRNSSGQ